MNDRILIIDDDIDMINYYSSVLKEGNYKIAFSYDTDKGIEIVRDFMPGLIILDVMMNRPDEGYGFANELIDNKIDVPVMISSSIARAGSEIFDLDIPNIKYVLQKPVEPDDLLSKVNKILKK